MRRHPITFAAACLAAAAWGLFADQDSFAQDTADARLKEVWYDPQSVVTILVKRGVVTDVALAADETITEVASGVAADCAKPEASWCVAAQAGGRHLFVKPKSTAGVANNLAVVTDQRTHSFRFVVLAERDSRPPVYRLTIKVAAPQHSFEASSDPADGALPKLPSPAELIQERLTAAPQPVNSSYSIAEGKGAEDIVPTLVFDDGRFTYLRFPNNREVPAIFHVLPDGTETVVNARMEGDLLVVDRVSRRLMLRAGSAAVGVWNDAFDLDGVPPSHGTTVSGVDRDLKPEPAQPFLRHGAPR